MNWLTNVVRPKIRSILRRETPEKSLDQVPDSGQAGFYKDVRGPTSFVISRLELPHAHGARWRGLKSIFDNETWYDIAPGPM